MRNNLRQKCFLRLCKLRGSLLVRLCLLCQLFVPLPLCKIRVEIGFNSGNILEASLTRRIPLLYPKLGMSIRIEVAVFSNCLCIKAVFDAPREVLIRITKSIKWGSLGEPGMSVQTDKAIRRPHRVLLTLRVCS